MSVNRDKLKIATGRLSRSHGVHGEIKLRPFFDAPVMERGVGKMVTLETEQGTSSNELKLVSLRPGGKTMIARFDTVDTPEDVSRFSGMLVKLPRPAMPDLPEGQYYREEITGLPVYDPEGRPLGVLSDFFSAGAKDVWVIKTSEGGEILTPCLPETLKEVDLETGRIVIELMEEED